MAAKRRPPASNESSLLLRSPLRRALRRNHEVVLAIFRDRQPFELLGAEFLPRLVDLAELRVLRSDLLVMFLGGLEARGQDVGGERRQDHAIGDQALQRRRVERVVLRQHPDVGLGAGRLQNRLVLRRQRRPGLDADQQVERRSALPPARVVVVLRDLVEAELLVVVGADPFGRVDRALFQRRVDVAAGDLLRHDAQSSERGPPVPPMRNFSPLRSASLVDRLAEPAAHLAAGVARRD